jgi:hypothetical protein
MKKYLYFLVVLLTACQPKQKEVGELVTVSILPQKYFVDQIAGNLLQVNVSSAWPSSSISTFRGLTPFLLISSDDRRRPPRRWPRSPCGPGRA